MDDEPKMIPWHRPELRELLKETLRSMAYFQALEDPVHRAEYERFKAILVGAPGKL